MLRSLRSLPFAARCLLLPLVAFAELRALLDFLVVDAFFREPDSLVLLFELDDFLGLACNGTESAPKQTTAASGSATLMILITHKNRARCEGWSGSRANLSDASRALDAR